MKTYQVISRTLGARLRCEAQGNNQEWVNRHQETLDTIFAELPSGSGFDNGTTFDESSTPERLVFNTSFHHMDVNGYYDGWTSHQVIVTPSLEMGCRMRITGTDRNDIKEVIADCFSSVLEQDIDEFPKATGTLPVEAQA